MRQGLVFPLAEEEGQAPRIPRVNPKGRSQLRLVRVEKMLPLVPWCALISSGAMSRARLRSLTILLPKPALRAYPLPVGQSHI